MAKGKASGNSKKRPARAVRSLFSLIFSLALGGLLLVAFGLGIYMLYLDAVIRAEFDQKRWAMPAKVYARPLELFEGMALGAGRLRIGGGGGWTRSRNTVVLITPTLSGRPVCAA